MFCVLRFGEWLVSILLVLLLFTTHWLSATAIKAEKLKIIDHTIALHLQEAFIQCWHAFQSQIMLHLYDKGNLENRTYQVNEKDSQTPVHLICSLDKHLWLNHDTDKTQLKNLSFNCMPSFCPFNSALKGKPTMFELNVVVSIFGPCCFSPIRGIFMRISIGLWLWIKVCLIINSFSIITISTQSWNERDTQRGTTRLLWASHMQNVAVPYLKISPNHSAQIIVSP